MRIESGNTLGMALLKALGISTECVTGLTLTCESGEIAEIAVRRTIKSQNTSALLEQVQKYCVVLADSATGESGRPSTLVPTNPDRPAGSRDSAQ